MNFQIKKPAPVREMNRFGGSCMGRAYGVTNRYMTRDGTPLERVETVDYTFNLPENTSYLEIHAYGNAAAIYHGDKLLGDFYLYGDEWVVDVRNIPDTSALTLKILPLTEQNRSKIYLEYDIPIGVITPTVYVREVL